MDEEYLVIDCFMDNHAELFTWLMRNVCWDERMRARKTASFGVAYTYSQISYPGAAIPPILTAICQKIESTLHFLPNNCLANFYPDGNASMGFHADNTAGLAPDSGVAVLSLGCQREIAFRPKRSTARSDTRIHTKSLRPGSLLFMGTNFQAHWQHAIPQTSHAAARISLTFREIVR